MRLHRSPQRSSPAWTGGCFVGQNAVTYRRLSAGVWVEDADEALMRAWNLGMDEEGWSDAVDEAELLLPVLIEEGYAEQTADTWSFTDKGVARAKELDAD